MKLPKTLLQAIAVSLTIGAATSCDLADQGNPQPNLHDETCEAGCEVDHEGQNSHNWQNCPACGMG